MALHQTTETTEGRPAPLPLSAAQEGIWRGQQLVPNQPLYNASECIALPGELDEAAFEAALRTTLAESEAVGARYGDERGVPHQRLHPYELELTRVELGPGASLEQAVELARDDLRRPFDLTVGDLSRHLLLRSARGSYWVHTAHHIALDGFGFSLIARRVAELYTAQVERRPAPPRSFGALRPVIDDDASYHASEALSRDRAYFQQRFAGFDGAVTLSERSAFPTGTPLRESTELTLLDKELLDRVARAARATWGDVLLALVATLVHRATATRDLVLGLPVMNRIGSASLRVPCMAMNILPLRIEVSRGVDLLTLTGQVAKARSELRPHARYRYEQLRRDLALRSAKRRLFGPVVNVMPFDYDLHFGALRGVAHNVSAGPVEDLSISIHARSDGRGPRVDLDAHPECYDRAELATYRAWLKELLAELCSAPERAVDREPQAPAELAREPLREGPPLRVPARDVIARVVEQARAHPTAAAIEHGERSISYGALVERAQALAARLAAEGAGPERIIALALPRSIDAIVCMLATLMCGAAYLPLDPEGPSERARAILGDARPLLVIAPSLERERIAALSECRTVALDDLSAAAESRALGPDTPSQLAYVIYTSGSTGAPNGVRVERGALAHFVQAALEHYELAGEERVLQFAPLQFDASVEEIFLSLCAGSTLVVRTEVMLSSISAFLRSCAALRVSVLDLPTAFFHELAYGLSADEPLPACVHTVIIGGEAALSERVERFLDAAPHARLFNSYGPTEATVVATAQLLSHGDVRTSASVPIGRPLPGVCAAILAADGGLVARGEAGELCLMGPALARGYIDRAQRERERFITLTALPQRPRAYRTGDLVRCDEHGALLFVGRVDDELKISGQRVDPREVEEVLLRHRAVREVAVIGQTLPAGAKRLAAFLVLEEPAPSASELRAYAQRALLPAQVPALFQRCAQLPRTANGKVDKRALLDTLKEPSSDGGSELLDGLERTVAELFREVLGDVDVGRDDDFFELGGQSLATIQIANRLSLRLGREIPVPWLFRHPTVRELAAALEGRVDTNVATDELQSDSLLPLDVLPRGESQTPGGALLLTGATGFVGVHLLRELLDGEPREVVCLVRGADGAEARRRLHDSLCAHALSTDGLERVRVLAADLARPRLGLSAEDYDTIAADCDAIYHCAASVSLTRGYASVRAANVLATLELLRLAGRSRTKALHYVSTLAVAPGRDVADEVPEEFFAYHPGLRDGYTQSKWASERLLAQARARGFDVAIYRLARVVGPADPTRATFVNRDDIVFRLLRAGIPAGVLPELPVSECWTPVDYVARAIVALSRSPRESAIFHLAPAEPLELGDLFDWVRRYGFPVESRPLPDFAARIRAHGDGDAQATLAFLELQAHAEPRAALGLGRIRCDNALRSTAHRDLRCPIVDRAVVEHYLDHCVATGLLPPPPESKST